jgi:hypothetical protein
MLRHSLALLGVIACLAGVGLAGCGSSSTSKSPSVANTTSTTGSTHFAKTKFLLHAGLAFGAFHHFIWKPIRDGALAHPFRHKLALIKAGLASLFVAHDLKQTAQAA